MAERAAAELVAVERAAVERAVVEDTLSSHEQLVLAHIAALRTEHAWLSARERDAAGLQASSGDSARPHAGQHDARGHGSGWARTLACQAVEC